LTPTNGHLCKLHILKGHTRALSFKLPKIPHKLWKKPVFVKAFFGVKGMRSAGSALDYPLVAHQVKQITSEDVLKKAT
jgi:hypothetical protein